MMQSRNNIELRMEHEEDRLIRADVAIVKLLELSGVHDDVIAVVGKLIEVRSESAANLSRLVEELSEFEEEIIVVEFVEFGIPA